jgi:hypothetical protein
MKWETEAWGEIPADFGRKWFICVGLWE